MDQIKIGIGVSSIGRFLPLIGKAAGLFDKENISVEVVNRQDEEKVVEDIVTQATPVGTPNAPSLIFSALEGDCRRNFKQPGFLPGRNSSDRGYRRSNRKKNRD